MRFSLCPVNFEPYAPLTGLLDEGKSQLDTLSRRLSRTATLDGGAVFYDAGHAVADRDVIVDLLNVTEELVLIAKRYTRVHADLTVSIPDGIFRCGLKSMMVQDDTLTLTLYLKSSASADG